MGVEWSERGGGGRCRSWKFGEDAPMLTMQGQQAVFSYSVWAGENVARAVPFPWTAWPHFGWWDCGRARCGCDRDWDWPLTKLGLVGLLFDDQCTSAPHSREHKIYFTISGHGSFPSPITRHGQLLAEVYQLIRYVVRRNTAACMAPTTASRNTSWDRHEVFILFRLLDGQGSTLMLVPERREI